MVAVEINSKKIEDVVWLNYLTARKRNQMNKNISTTQYIVDKRLFKMIKFY